MRIGHVTERKLGILLWWDPHKGLEIDDCER